MSSPSVLVVGGGPTGLVLALALAKNSVPVRVIEKFPGPIVGQRGAGLQPRTLEIHNFLGTYNDIAQRGQPIFKFRMYPIGAGDQGFMEREFVPHIEPSDSTPLPNPWRMGQDTQTEILRSHLAKHGVFVETGTELRKFEQKPDHVEVEIVKLDGGKETIEIAQFPYIVGADGASSIIRKGLDVTFLGETRDTELMLVGDVHIEEGAPAPGFFHLYGDASTSMLGIRDTEHENRYSFNLAGAELAIDDLLNNRDELLQVMTRISGRTDIKWGEVTWLSKYRPNIRMADRFGSGRCFIAGDAAHVHSPSGGQGMNSGCMDAFNLAWKLALVVKGLAKPSLLVSYTDERLPVIATMLKMTTKLHRTVITQGNTESGWRRDGSLTQLGVNSRGSPIVVDERTRAQDVVFNPYDTNLNAPRVAGDRAPDSTELHDLKGASDVTRLFQIYGPAHHTVLVFAGTANDAKTLLDATLKAAKSAPLRSVVVLPLEAESVGETTSAANYVLVDQKGLARRNYQVEASAPPTAVVVRPDGVLGAIATRTQGVETYFGNILL
ncbi:hypothetical protein HGRIS_005134 [Hohenbuehelia grisea]|uniref:FAD-binding domain-containing protein n=1 Tax=Hohenbuehelia grisea TaxID=104357 RepID=A0ABR3JE20_9AGAR